MFYLILLKTIITLSHNITDLLDWTSLLTHLSSGVMAPPRPAGEEELLITSWLAGGGVAGLQ